MLVDSTGKILDCNQIASCVFEYEPDELTGNDFECLIPPIYRDKYRRFLAQCNILSKDLEPEKTVSSFFFEGLKKGGGKVPIQVCVNPTIDENLQGYALAIFDASESVHLNMELENSNQRLLRKTEELSKLVCQQNHFLNVLSHELRTPMNASINALNLLQQTKLDKGQQRLFQDLDTSSADISWNIRRVMDYADLQLGVFTLSTEDFDLLSLVLEVVRQAQRHYPMLSERMVLELDFPKSPIIEGDRERMARLIEGFIGNAVKFSKATEIRIRATYVPESKGCLAKFSFEVRDNGVGISEQLQRELGRPFANQLERRKLGSGGMGIGYFLAIKYLKLMGGALNFVTQLNHGTAVGFDCPVSVVQQESRFNQRFDTKPSLGRPLNGLKILMVEDDVMVRRINALLLTKLGADVEVAEDGQLALSRCSLNPQATDFQLILMDLHMPNMDGFTATREIRQIPAYAHTPIFALTAASRHVEFAKAMSCGMDFFIEKPLKVEVMLKLLGSLGVLPHLSKLNSQSTLDAIHVTAQSKLHQ